MTEEKRRTCFVVSQIGDDDSVERLHADWVYEEIISHVFQGREPSYALIRADKISAPGLIDAQIIDYLLNCDLVIADLTNLNPNVFYEIGIRHVAAKPIIHIHLKGQNIPFDVSLYRSMPFALSHPSNLRQARSELRALVEASEAPGFEVDNPVVRARGKVKFENTATSKEKIIESTLLQMQKQIDTLEKKFAPADLPSYSRFYGDKAGASVSKNRKTDDGGDSYIVMAQNLNDASSRSFFQNIANVVRTAFQDIVSDVIVAGDYCIIVTKPGVDRGVAGKIEAILRSSGFAVNIS